MKRKHTTQDILDLLGVPSLSGAIAEIERLQDLENRVKWQRANAKVKMAKATNPHNKALYLGEFLGLSQCLPSSQKLTINRAIQTKKHIA